MRAPQTPFDGWRVRGGPDPDRQGLIGKATFGFVAKYKKAQALGGGSITIHK